MVKSHPVLDCIAQHQTEKNLKLQAAFKGLGLQWPADAHRRCHCCVTKPVNKLPASWLHVGGPDSTNKWFIFASLENGRTDVGDCFCFCGWVALWSLVVFIPHVSPFCFEAYLVGETCSERGVINHTRKQIMEIVLFLFVFSEDYVWIEGHDETKTLVFVLLLWLQDLSNGSGSHLCECCR